MRVSRSDNTIAVIVALGLHIILLVMLIWGKDWFTSATPEPLAGPMIEADLVDLNALSAATRRALNNLPTPQEDEPLPTPVAENSPPPPAPKPVPEEPKPAPVLPQPLPEPKPQQAEATPQPKAQELLPVPDKVNQERIKANALAEEAARKKEQEQKQRQEQVDLTERERQKEAEAKKRLAEQSEAEKNQKRLEQIRREREQATRERESAEKKLRELAAQSRNNASSSAPAASSSTASPPPGQNGDNTALLAQYVASIQQKVSREWNRPENVPLGKKCRVNIVQIAGGEVIEAKVAADCSFDDAGRRSLEAAILKAQPLPYRGFEKVFNRNLNFTFTAAD